VINAFYAITREQNHIFSDANDQKSSTDIKGIKLNHYIKEKKIFSIQAEEIAIKKKKIGFFRIGGLKQLELKNTMIDYYEPPEESKEQQDIITCFSKTTRSFSLYKDKLSGFIALHVTIRYHHLGGTFTIIHAPLMEIEHDTKRAIFRKSTSAHYLNKFLLCKHMYFDFQNSFLMSHDHYTFITNGKLNKGKGIKTNLKLDLFEGSQ
jgi:hypothetical protein